MSWRDDALNLGWPPHVIDAFAYAVASQQGEVLLVHRDVLALRTGGGALQRTLRSTDSECLASANRATEHLPGLTKTPDPFCTTLDCRFRVPCPYHRPDASVGEP